MFVIEFFLIKSVLNDIGFAYMELCTLIRLSLELIKRLLGVVLRNQDKTKHKHNKKQRLQNTHVEYYYYGGKLGKQLSSTCKK